MCLGKEKPKQARYRSPKGLLFYGCNWAIALKWKHLLFLWASPDVRNTFQSLFYFKS